MAWSDWLAVQMDLKHARAEAIPSAWERIGDDHYTCVPPVGYEPDPAVTSALHEFDPGAIPIWRLQRWKAPGSVNPRVIVHVGIARYYPDPKYERNAFHVDMPQDTTHPQPNYLDRFFEGDPIGFNAPGEYQRWDWAVVAYCRRKWEGQRMTVRHFDKKIEDRKEREALIRANWQTELAYIRSWIEPWILQKMESAIGAGDWEDYESLMAYGAGRARRAGVWNPSHDRRRIYV